jgi:large subunit ribosomal protein L14
MLQERSVLNIADNSGALKVMLFAVNGKNNQYSVGVGSIVMGSVKKSSPNAKVKKGQKVHVLIVRTKAKINRKDGSSIRFSDNAAIVINKANGEPVGTRVFGPVARELREKDFKKVVSLSEEVL